MSKQRTKWLIGSMVCILLVAGIFFVPYISKESESFSSLIHLNEGEDGEAVDTGAAENVVLTFSFPQGLESFEISGAPGSKITEFPNFPAFGVLTGNDGKYWSFKGWLLEGDFPDELPQEDTSIQADVTPVYLISFTGDEGLPEPYYAEAGALDLPELDVPDDCSLVWTLDGEDLGAGVTQYTITDGDKNDFEFVVRLQTQLTVKLLGEKLPDGDEVGLGECTGIPVTVGQSFSLEELLGVFDELPDEAKFVPADESFSFTVSRTGTRIVTIAYERVRYTASFYTAENELYEDFEVPYEGKIEKPDVNPTRDGYDFDGWLGFEEPVYMDTESLEFYADFTARTDTSYTVQLIGEKLPGGDAELLLEADFRGETDSYVSAGYIFEQLGDISTEIKGFSFDQEANGNFQIPGNGKGVYKLYYLRNSYELTLVERNEIDGEEIIAYQGEVLYNQPLSAIFDEVANRQDANSPKGQRFDGWDTNDNVMPDHALKIAAKYIYDSYEVKFLNYDGAEIETKNVVFGQSIPETQLDFYRDGYSFLHWGFEPQSYAGVCGCQEPDITFDEGEGPILNEEGLTLYAHYAPNENTPYKLWLMGQSLDGDSFNLKLQDDAISLTGTSDSEITLQDILGILTEKGIAFEGFSFDESTPGFIISPSGDGEYNVRFTRNKYTLNIIETDFDGVTKIPREPLEVYYKTPLVEVLPSADDVNGSNRPKGKEFIGWDDESYTTMPALEDGLTLTAEYDFAAFSVEFRDYDYDESSENNLSAKVTVTFGQKIFAPDNIDQFTRQGYGKPVHWSTEQYSGKGKCPCGEDSFSVSFGSEAQDVLLDEEGLVLYAHYAPNENTPFTLLLIFERYEKGVFDDFYVDENGDKQSYEIPMDIGVTDADTPFDREWLRGYSSVPGYRYDGVEEESQAIEADGSTVFRVRFVRIDYVLRMVQLKDGVADSEKAQSTALRFGAPVEETLAKFVDDSKNPENTAQYQYGHEFDCWMKWNDTLEDYEEYDPNGTKLPAGGVTLFARYKPAKWNAVFNHDHRENYEDETVELKTDEQEIYFGGEFVLPTETGGVRNYGYELIGWHEDDCGVEGCEGTGGSDVKNCTNFHVPGETLEMDKENRSFTAVWVAVKYTVTFEYEKGDPGTAVKVNQEYSFNESFNFPDEDKPITADTADAWAQESGRVKKGYSLVEWVCKEDNSIKLAPDAQATMLLEGGMTFVATQTINKYPVIFKWGYSESQSKTVMVEYKGSINDALDGEDGLVWFWSCDGSCNQEGKKNNTADYANAAEKNKAVFKGYSIDTWQEEPRDISETKGIDRHDHYPDFGTASDNTRIFKAISTALKWPVTLRRYIEGAGWSTSEIPDPDRSVTFDTLFYPPNLNNHGFQYFVDWCTDEALTKPLRGGTDPELLMNEEGMTLYARFAYPVEYRISGKTLKTDYVNQFSDEISPSKRWQPTPDTGYHFDGWTGEDVSLTKMPARRVTFEGVYEINRFDVTFRYKDKSGKWLDSRTERYAYGQILQLPSPLPNPSNSNYESFFNTNTEKFTGWSGSIVPESTKATGNHNQKVVYTAQYRTPKIQSFTASLPNLHQGFAAGKLIDLGSTDLVLKVVYDNGKSETLDHVKLIKNKTVSYTPQSFDTAGKKIVEITYKSPEGETVSCKMEVMVNPRFVTSIKISKMPTKTTYTVGEKLNLTGGELELRYNNGTRSYISLKDSSVVVSGYSSKKAMSKLPLTVTYTSSNSSFTSSFTVTVKEKTKARAKGDVNGDGKINSLDMLMVRQYILGISKLKTAEFNAADVNTDGKVNSLDAMLILRHVLGIQKIK